MTKQRQSRIALLAVAMLLSGVLVGFVVSDNASADNDVVGFVKASSDQAPISNVSVVIINQDSGTTESVTTGEGGSFSFNSLASGNYMVRYSKLGHLSVLDSWDISDNSFVGTTEMSSATSGSTSVIVNVVDGDGMAVENALVNLMLSDVSNEDSWWDNVSVGYTLSQDTDAEGNASFTNLTDDTYDIRVEAEGYYTTLGSTDEVSLTLMEHSDDNKQTITVYDGNNFPLSDATVFMYDNDTSTWTEATKYGSFSYILKPDTGTTAYVYAYHSSNQPAVEKLTSISGPSSFDMTLGQNTQADNNVVYISEAPSHGAQGAIPKVEGKLIKVNPGPSALIAVTSHSIGSDGEYIVADGEQVNFSAQTSNSPVGVSSYSWSPFGTSTVETANTFSSGSTEVILTVTDTFGAFSRANVTVMADGSEPIPVVDITVKAGSSDEGEPYNGSNVNEQCTGLCSNVSHTVIFNASGSSDTDSMISDYSWDFGDNNTDTGDVVFHEFADPGTFDVQLTVTDIAGNSASHIMPITVNDIEAPRAAFNWSYTNDTGGIVTGATMEDVPTHFNAGGTDDNSCIEECSALNYTWDFGDGNSGFGIETDHTFDETSEDGFNVILIVTDASGNKDQITYKISPAMMDRPDLYISSLFFSNDNPSEGDTIKINATIKLLKMNVTDAFAVTFYVDSISNTTALHTIEVDNGSLAWGIENEYVVETTWKATSGTHTIYAVVDATELIDESEEKNDISRVVTVSSVDDSRDWTSIGLIVVVVLLAFGAVGYIYRDTLFK